MYVLGASCVQLDIAVVFILSLCMKLVVVVVSDCVHCGTGGGQDSWPLVTQLIHTLFLFY